MADSTQLFQSVPVPEYPSSQFNGNHHVKSTTRIGALTPVKCIKYHPGDTLRLKSVTHVEFPPLLSPAFQSFKLKEFIFKIRKGLTFDQEAFGRFILASSNNTQAPQMPFVAGANEYYFGDAVVVCSFNPKLPVYGMIKNGDILFQTSDFPSASINDVFLNITTYSDDARKAFFDSLRDAWEFRVIYRNRVSNALEAEDHINPDPSPSNLFVRPAFTKSRLSLANTGELIPFTTSPSSATYNNTTFLNYGPIGNNFSDVFLRHTPFYRNKELMESLGYPTLNLALEQTFWVREFLRKWNEFLDMQISQPNDPSLKFDGLRFTDFDHLSASLDNPFLAISVNSTSLDSVPAFIQLLNLLQVYSMYMISHGHGDGSVMDASQMCSISEYPLKDFLCFPVDRTGSPFSLDLGPLSSFWLVWNEYFRDPNLTQEVPILKLQGDILSYSNITRLTSDFLNTSLNTCELPNGVKIMVDYTNSGMTANELFAVRDYVLKNEFLCAYTSIPQKCIDRNYFTSALPKISEVQVFAPVVPSLPTNGVVPDLDNPVDYKPTQSVDPTTTFMSIEAFRTANVMQNFFVNSMLAGPRPVSFILMQFGEHSKDFRMEVPVLVDASEMPISVTDLTQQSETEQLPLGHQAGKMSVIKGLNEGYQTIDSEGDYGYVLRLICVYPEIFEVGGLNRDLLCDSPYSWMFFPQFAILGEQSIMSAEVDNQPIDFSDMVSSSFTQQDVIDALVNTKQTFDVDYGYTERYGHLKRIQNETHGRFLNDLSYWTLDRIKRPYYFSFSNPLRVSQPFIEIPLDNTRMFVSSEIEECKFVSFTDCQFYRKLPYINPVKLL